MAGCPLSLYVVHWQGQQSFHYWSQLGPQLSFWPSPHFPWEEASSSWHASSAVQSITFQWSGYPLHQETNFSLAASRLSQEALGVFGCFTAVEDPAFEFSSPEGESTSLRLLTVRYQQQQSWECQGQQNSHHWCQMGQEAGSSQDVTFLEGTLCLSGFFIASLILVLDYKGVHPHQETFISLPIWTPHQSPERYWLLLHDGRRCSIRAFSAGNIPHASNHPLSLSIGTGNLLPLSQLDLLLRTSWALSFLEKSLPLPGLLLQAYLTLLGDVAHLHQDTFFSPTLSGSLIRVPDGYWLLEVSPATFCLLPLWTGESPLLVLPVPTSTAELSAPPETHSSQLAALLVCPIHLGVQVTHMHQETSFAFILSELSTVATW